MEHPLLDERPARVAAEERMADIVLPNQTNGFGTMFGGDVMAMMDKAAAIAALRFCRQPVVTASSERTDFRIPISQGEIIEALARVIYVGKTSIVVRIHLYAEHPLLGDRRLCTTGYFSMVAVGAGEEPPLPVPGLLLEDDEARQEWRVGEEIHQGVVIRRRQQKASQF
ncbi:MAG: acyl-CoA thioesterase [Chloroflexales bacterium]|nr:acyl-CoA thioesterase [Chloroflexales bacterium]